MDRKHVLSMIRDALKESVDQNINDVDEDTGVNGQPQIILTTQDAKGLKQVWIIDDQSIIEHDAEHLEPEEPLTFSHLFEPGYGIMLLTKDELDKMDWLHAIDHYVEPDKFNILNEDGYLLAAYGDKDIAIMEFKIRLDATHD